MSLFDVLEEHREGFEKWSLTGDRKVEARTHRDYVYALETYGKSICVPSDIVGYYSTNGIPLPEKVSKGVGRLIRYLNMAVPPDKRSINGYPYSDYQNAFNESKDATGSKSNSIAHDVTAAELKQWIANIPAKFRTFFKMLAYSGARIEQQLSIFKQLTREEKEKLSEVIMPSDENGLVAPVFRIDVSEYGSERKRTGHYYFPMEIREEVLAFTGEGVAIDTFVRVVREAAPKREKKSEDKGSTIISAKTLRKWNTNLMIKSGVPAEVAGWIEGRVPNKSNSAAAVTWKNYADLDTMAAQAYSQVQSVLLEALPLEWFDVEPPKPKYVTPQKTSDERKAKMVEMYRAGKTQTEIANELKTNRTIVRKYLREAGLVK